jgi:3-oxochol-4-en-24-oyl-CoA dehydrogenase
MGDDVNFEIPSDSRLVRDMFERFFATESSMVRVRAAEQHGFDPQLWRSLIALDAPFMRMPAPIGGESSLFDACLVMEAAGRHLASVPLAESIVAHRVLGQLDGDAANRWVDRARSYGDVLTTALQQTRPGSLSLVPGGGVAAGILHFDGEVLAIGLPDEPLASPANLGSSALDHFQPGGGKCEALANGDEARRAWSSGVEEWKILMSAALFAMADKVTGLAAAYASERKAFGQPIGAYQAIAHPLADAAIAADGGRLLIWRTLKELADEESFAAASISKLFWWATRTATRATAHALHTFGGYGLTNDYDLQLFHRRAKAWPLAAGDPQRELVAAGRRLLLGEAAATPEPGPVAFDFRDSPSPNAPLAVETRDLFNRVLDPERHLLHDHSFSGHAWDVHKALGEARLIFPAWPANWGGRDADQASARASRSVWREVGYSESSLGVTEMVGAVVMEFGSPDLQEEVLRTFAAGEKTVSLGYTEPSCGSDVFAARTRATRDGEDWIINGQKMFTSGAEHASYIFVIARTDPDAPKHRGITMFLVPTDLPGFDIQPVQTFMDERTNATFFSEMRVPDRYRIGGVDEGVKVLSFALTLEQGGGGFERHLRELAGVATDWARTAERGDGLAISDPQVQERIMRVRLAADISELLSARVRAVRQVGEPYLAYGPAAKVFCTEAFIAASADLLDLAAPESLIRGKSGLGIIEMGYRHSAATSIYGGTSEVLRSMVAEKRLGLPRSRA